MLQHKKLFILEVQLYLDSINFHTKQCAQLPGRLDMLLDALFSKLVLELQGCFFAGSSLALALQLLVVPICRATPISKGHRISALAKCQEKSAKWH